MLVITRKVGETLYTSDGMKIQIVEVRGEKVRLGIEAPDATRIFREEIAPEDVKRNVGKRQPQLA